MKKVALNITPKRLKENLWHVDDIDVKRWLTLLKWSSLGHLEK